MANSLRPEDIERAVVSGVRAALQGVLAPTPATANLVNTPSPSTSSAASHRPVNTLPPPIASTSSATSAGAGTSQRLVPFPSYFQSRRSRSGYQQRKNVKSFTKDIVCLPFSPRESVFVIPRGENRSRLAQAGLIGKISFTTEWSEDQLREEISAIFRGAFGISEHDVFPFQFLSTIKGCKKLMKPNVTPNFPWGGKEVSSVCSNTCLYIMAEMEMPTQHRFFDTDDSDFERPTFRRRDLETLEQSNVEGQYEPMEADATDLSVTNREHETEPGGTRFSDFIPLDFEEEEAVEEAIGRSLEEETVQFPQELRSIKTLTTEEITGIVKAHSEMVVTEGFRSIIVSRRNVWTSAIRQFRRPKFVESTDMLYVTFASDENTTEDAEDLGGPRREFFRLLVKAIFQESGAFEESPNGFIPRLNVSHVQNRVYRTIGQMMSTIIVQGGECPALLSSVVLDYLLTGRMFDICVSPEDVADVELRDSLKTIDQATTDDDLQRAIESCESWRYQIEGLPNPVTMDNKDAFVKNATIFHVLLQRKSCYDQLAEGLECYELLPLLKENLPLRVLLEMPKVRSDLTADVVATLLKPSYSVLGSNKRPKEELMVVKFRDFLNSVQEREVEECLRGRTLTEAEETFLRNLNPGHILAFVTGSSRVPAVGFQPSPKLSFVHNENKYLPVAHTCSNELEIFVNSKNLADNDEFEYNFLVALMNGANFSAV